MKNKRYIRTCKYIFRQVEQDTLGKHVQQVLWCFVYESVCNSVCLSGCVIFSPHATSQAKRDTIWFSATLACFKTFVKVSVFQS